MIHTQLACAANTSYRADFICLPNELRARFGEPDSYDKTPMEWRFVDDAGNCYTVYAIALYRQYGCGGRSPSPVNGQPYKFHVGCRLDVDPIPFIAWLKDQLQASDRVAA